MGEELSGGESFDELNPPKSNTGMPTGGLPRGRPIGQPQQHPPLSGATAITSNFNNKDGVAYLQMMASPLYVPHGASAKAKLTDIVIAKRGEDYALERGSCTDFLTYVEGKGPESTKQLTEEEYNLGQLVEEAQTFGKERASALGIDNVFVVIKPNEPLHYHDGMVPLGVIKGPITLVARDEKFDYTRILSKYQVHHPGGSSPNAGHTA